MSADHYCQLLNIVYYCCWKPVSAFVLGVEDGIYPLLQSSSVGAGSNKANGGSNGQPQAGGGANNVGSARQQQQQQQQQQQPQQQSQQGSKPVECNLCHRTFKNIPALNGHMRLHGGYFKKVRTRCNISVYWAYTCTCVGGIHPQKALSFLHHCGEPLYLNFSPVDMYMGTAVAQWLRCCATNREVAGSIPDGVIEIFHWHNPSDRTMVLGSTQPLTEMGTRSISWG